MKVRPMIEPQVRTRTSLSSKIKMISASASFVALALTVTFFWNDIFKSEESVANPGQTTFSARMHIDIDELYILPANESGFESVFLTISDESLKSTIAGGNMYSTKAEDIQFVSADGNRLLFHQTEYYNDRTGELNCWVKLPVNYQKENSMVILQYGNAMLASLKAENSNKDVFDKSNLLDHDGNVPHNPMETDFMEDEFETSGSGKTKNKIPGSNTLALSDISLYPNPNDGSRVHIGINKNLEKQINISLFNESGIVVYSATQSPSATLEIIPNNVLDNGTYVMQLGYDGQLFSKKLLVKK